MRPVLRLTVLMTVFGCVSVVAQPVTSQMLLDGLKDPAKWLMFGGDYTSQRHSPLRQLTPQNVDEATPGGRCLARDHSRARRRHVYHWEQ
jgi:glucose dehydrogenase